MARKQPTAPPPDAALLGLVQDCKDHPEDDGLRGILADYLEDHGEPERAELIRLSLQVGRPLVDAASQAALHARLVRLQHDNEEAWFGGLRQFPGIDFDRGFLSLTTDLATVRRRAVAPALAAARLWSERLVVTDCPNNQVAAFFRLPWATAFSRLDLMHLYLGPAEMEALAQSPLTPHLRELRLMGGSGARDATLPLFRPDCGLTNLRLLAHHADLNQKGVRMLVRAPFAGGLKSLLLNTQQFPQKLLAELLGNGSLPSLQTLILLGRLTQDGIETLAGSGRRLRTLRLCYGQLTDASIETLARSPALGEVRHLDLSHNSLGDGAAIALAGSPHLGNLESLRLNHNWAISDLGLAALANSERLPRLRHLGLLYSAGDRHLGPPGIRALAEAAGLARLRTLDLSSSRTLSAADWRGFGQSARLPALRDLCLTGIALSPEKVEALVSGPVGANLRHLHLGDLGAGLPVIKFLARTPALRHLESLHLDFTDHAATGLGRLAESTTLERLLWLQINPGGDTAAGLERLAAKVGLPSLMFLNFTASTEPLPAEVVAALLRSPRRADLLRTNLHVAEEYPPEFRELCRPIPQTRGWI